MNFSIYTTIYLVEKNNFPFIHHLSNFSKFAGDGEVVIGTCEEGLIDGTERTILDYIKNNNLNNVKLVISDTICFKDKTFDGDLKNLALQNTQYPIKILLDLDEKIPVEHRDLWKYYFNLLEAYNLDGWLIPSINLAGDIYHCKDVGYKMYMHRVGLKRGVWKDALNKDGSIDISKSDTTEVITNDGSLAKMGALPKDLESLKTGQIPYVFHYWAVDKDARVRQNSFWKPHWENRAQRPVNDIILDKKELEKIEVFRHNLPIE